MFKKYKKKIIIKQKKDVWYNKNDKMLNFTKKRPKGGKPVNINIRK
jgi:hypothetical protein